MGTMIRRGRVGLIESAVATTIALAPMLMGTKTHFGPPAELPNRAIPPSGPRNWITSEVRAMDPAEIQSHFRPFLEMATSSQ